MSLQAIVWVLEDAPNLKPHLVGVLHRPDYQDPENERAGEIDIIVGKNRNGICPACGQSIILGRTVSGHYRSFNPMPRSPWVVPRGCAYAYSRTRGTLVSLADVLSLALDVLATHGDQEHIESDLWLQEDSPAVREVASLW